LTTSRNLVGSLSGLVVLQSLIRIVNALSQAKQGKQRRGHRDGKQQPVPLEGKLSRSELAGRVFSVTKSILQTQGQKLWLGGYGNIAELAATAFALLAISAVDSNNRIRGVPWHGGEGGIRTPDRLAPMPHFECGAFDHSATSPGAMTGGQKPFGRAVF
jgi:hypothetical protein